MEKENLYGLQIIAKADSKIMEKTLLHLTPKVHKWLYRLLGPQADLEDATQIALFELAKSLPSYKGESSLYTWSYKITLRVGRRYFGSQKTFELDLENSLPTELDPESTMMQKEILHGLYSCLEKLPKKRRVAFVLCAIEGHSPAEAAKICETTSLVMRSRLSRARADMIELLKTKPYVREFIECSAF